MGGTRAGRFAVASQRGEAVEGAMSALCGLETEVPASLVRMASWKGMCRWREGIWAEVGSADRHSVDSAPIQHCNGGSS